MHGSRKDDRNDKMVYLDECEESMASQETHGEVDYDADDEYEVDSNGEEVLSRVVSKEAAITKNTPIVTRRAQVASSSSPSPCQGDTSRRPPTWIYAILYLCSCCKYEQARD
ncbi:conserved hypothetical protein [Echinococcus multilocularis]|uniref:Uncharacterized protein n=1 Tax=Echinococcus multilocularis TaxID=6211 RepID=A0A068YHM1_ECHMU|nr:conserved hypothetical protein [Echinococcus multilocularis]